MVKDNHTPPMNLDELPCGLMRVSEQGILLHINQTLLDWLGYQRAELELMHIDVLFNPAARMFYLTSILPLLQHQRSATEMYLRLKNSEGDEVPVLLNGERQQRNGAVAYDFALMAIQKRHLFEEQLLNARLTAERAVLAQEQAFRELEETRQALEDKQRQLMELNRQLEIMATTDPLTGLANRREFETALKAHLADWKRHHHPFTLALIDVDFFKQINDTFGHDRGDEVLASVASVLANEARETDFVARIGGEEFALLLASTRQPEARPLAERLRRGVQDRALDRVPGDTRVTISIGLAEARHEDTPTTLFTRADQALYAAKNGGRNRICEAGNVT